MHFLLCLSYDHLCNVVGEMNTYNRDTKALLPKIAFICPILDWIMSLLNLYADPLTPNVTVFQDRVFKEAIKHERGHQDGAFTGPVSS